MNFSSFLRRFGAAATLVAIRSAVAEDYRPARYELVSDPWFALDFDYQTAYTYEPVVVTW